MGARPWRQTLGALFCLVVLVAVPTAAALLRVYVRQDCLALGYRLSVEQQRRDVLRAQLRKAELTRARGRTPAALGAMAERLHLGPPRPGQTLGAPAAAGKPSPKAQAKVPSRTGAAANPTAPSPGPVVQPAAKAAPKRAQPH